MKELIKNCLHHINKELNNTIIIWHQFHKFEMFKILVMFNLKYLKY